MDITKVCIGELAPINVEGGMSGVEHESLGTVSEIEKVIDTS
jgi:hypothetical protein